MTQTNKRIMREFTIDEISGVDRPAQAHARMTIMKRKESPMNMQTVGHDEPMSFPTLQGAIAHLKKVHCLSGVDALRTAARKHPDLVKRYNAEGREVDAKAAETAAKVQPKPKAVEQFELAVDAIMQRDKCSRTVALQRARKENPDLYAGYQLA